MLIIPAIDLIGGRCVRLLQGNYDHETVYSDDPLQVAKGFESEGAEWLHVVDLDGARLGKPQNSDVVRLIRSETNLKVEFGGGIRDYETASHLLNDGVADRIILGTKLIEDEELAVRLFSEFGEDVVAGIDARNGKVAISGWNGTSSVDTIELATRMQNHGAKRIILTDIARDGMLTGPNLEFLGDVLAKVSIPVIQSGGISSIDDIQSLRSMKPKAPEGVIIGKALYEKRFTLSEAINN